jgi:hypothetical protein
MKKVEDSGVGEVDNEGVQAFKDQIDRRQSVVYSVKRIGARQPNALGHRSLNIC